MTYQLGPASWFRLLCVSSLEEECDDVDKWIFLPDWYAGKPSKYGSKSR